MPIGPNGQKRPDDVNSNAVAVAKIAIRESDERPARTTVLVSKEASGDGGNRTLAYGSPPANART